jgi:hypothetical protein
LSTPVRSVDPDALSPTSVTELLPWGGAPPPGLPFSRSSSER